MMMMMTWKRGQSHCYAVADSGIIIGCHTFQITAARNVGIVVCRPRGVGCPYEGARYRSEETATKFEGRQTV